jgi:acyl carrier protein
VVSDDDALRAFLVSELLDGKDVSLSADDDLVEEGLIDSLGIFELVSFMEDQLGVAIEPEDIVLENFSTLAAMRRLVGSKRR